MIHFIEPFIPFDSNCYLLTGTENVLIDTGSGLSARQIISAIVDIVGEEGKLDRILLTHCHFDHIGGCSDLIDAFGCKVYVGSKDAIPVRDSDPYYTLSTDFGLKNDPIPVEDLYGGDIIDLGEHRLQVIETPGHTLGGVCYYDQISSSLFSGDTVFSYGVGRTDFHGGSLEDLRKSIKYLEDMPVQGLYPGHGEPTEDGHSAIRRGLALIG